MSNELKRIELIDLILNDDSERIRLLLKIIEADSQSLEVALSEAKTK